MTKQLITLTLAASVIAAFPVSAVTLPEQAADQAVAHVPACAPNPQHPDTPRCHAQVVKEDKGSSGSTSTAPSGYGPAQFLGAYGLSGTAPSGQIIAVVDAYNHPNIKSDLDFYSTYFGIPVLPTCSGSVSVSSVPCFQKVDQNGGTAYPAPNSGWALEIALDVEAAHAMCQNCSILLVEATSNSYSNLMVAIDRAVAMGATEVSNSWGSSEFSSESAYDSHLNHPGIAVTFSSGDNGYGASYPAASPYVTAVGGTTLNVSGTSYSSESAWSVRGAVAACTRPQSQRGKQILCVQHELLPTYQLMQIPTLVRQYTTV